MSERIDHAAEARKLIAWGEEWMGEEGSTDATNLATALHTVAHAQLALVEQQRITNEQARIANIIAIANNVSEDPDVTVTDGERAAWLALCDEESPHSLRPEIREALGL